jgi:Family of unknown function (DUF6582)
MPLRYMHQLDAVGCGKTIDFDDAAKTIRMGFAVVDTNAITKVKKGVLTGFSQGGQYVRKWKANGIDYYTASPGEVSLVDSPCLPAAHFEYVKADGHSELRKFAQTEAPRFSEADADLIAAALRKSLEDKPLAKEEKTKRKGGKDLHASDFAYVGDPEDTSTWKLPIHDAAHARNALARFNQTQGIPEGEKAKVKAKIKAAAKKHGIEVSDEATKISKAVKYLAASLDGTLVKSLWSVHDMIEVTQTLAWLHESALYERDFEGDASTQPEDLAALMDDAILCLTSMVEEETEELKEMAARAASSGKGAKAMTPEELKKAADDLLAKAKSASAHLKELDGHLDKMHKAHSSHMDNAKECLGKCMKALGADGASDVGQDAHNMDPTTGAPHTASSPTTAKGFVSIGKTADGVEIFKRAPEDPLEAKLEAFGTALLTKVGEMVDVSLTAMVKAMFDSNEGGSGTVAKGLGNRELVVPANRGPHVTQPVTKGTDNQPPTEPVTTEEAPTREDVIKAAHGDIQSQLKLAKWKRSVTPEEAQRMEDSMVTTKVMR